MERETVTVAVCATTASSLAELARILSKAGSWGIVPIHWPNEAAWSSALDANAYVVDSDGISDDLLANLRARTVPRVWERLLAAGISAGAVRAAIDVPCTAPVVLL